MITTLSSFTFGNPWILAALLALPLIYWLIKITPPSPKTITFSAIQFLLKLQKKEETTTSLPWWLMVLRLIIAALIIIALADPKLNSTPTQLSKGPAVILIDDGWASAPLWDKIEVRLEQLLSELEDQQRLVYLLPLAKRPANQPLVLKALRPVQAKNEILWLQPKSWGLDRAQISPLLDQITQMQDVSFYWFSDGIEADTQANKTQDIFSKLSNIGPLTIYKDGTKSAPLIIGNPELRGRTTFVPVSKVKESVVSTKTLIARGATGKILAQSPIKFTNAQRQIDVELNLPTQLRNEITFLEIKESKSAASRYLMDSRHKRKQLGLVATHLTSPVQPLLRENHYLEKALVPYFELEKASLRELLTRDKSLIVMGDAGAFSRPLENKIKAWINKGGIFVRFAGPKLANSKTTITPVRLRSGSRHLDGSISWSKPAPLGKMPDHSPFISLSVPLDIKIKKQVLAVPSVDLNLKTWARLDDGTPLVTANRWGEGRIILFHTSATPKWSNLVLSGLFVEMLQEIGHLANKKTSPHASKSIYSPLILMNGFGQFHDITPTAKPLNFTIDPTPLVGPSHPAGYYGDPVFKIALNIGASPKKYHLMDMSAITATVKPLAGMTQLVLHPYLLLMVFLLVLLDLLLVLFLQGRLFSFTGRNRGSLGCLGLLVSVLLSLTVTPHTAEAKDTLDRLLEATLDTRLAYVLTGTQKVDQMSQAGLQGLSTVLTRRTSIETAAPLAINIEENELLFFPFVYWPITADFPSVSNTAIDTINRYLSAGGLILFDTRNQNTSNRYGGVIANSPENKRLRHILSRLHVPRLKPVPVDHVLTRAFYLMQSFPGRYADGDVWISDTTEISGTDGVSSILIGSNDWAAAWAIGKEGRPLASVLPGGDRQRELARRFGVNLVMYSLTGSYKADQVHIPAILDRLSQ